MKQELTNLEPTQEYIEHPAITPDLSIEERRKIFKKHKNKRFYKRIEKPEKTDEERRASLTDFKRDISRLKEQSYILRFFAWLSNLF